MRCREYANALEKTLGDLGPHEPEAFLEFSEQTRLVGWIELG
jgi:hypothetical protein